MLDRRQMMWDFIKTVIDASLEVNGMVFIACSDSAEAHAELSEARDAAEAEPARITNGTIKFGKIVFTRCDRFLAHSGETRNSPNSTDILGKTAPFVAALMSQTTSLISNTAEQKPLYLLIMSLKRSEIDNEQGEGKGEAYCAQQTWFAQCIAPEILSLYGSNMMKYGIMAECLWVNHKMSKHAGAAGEKGNYEVEYGVSTDVSSKA